MWLLFDIQDLDAFVINQYHFVVEQDVNVVACYLKTSVIGGHKYSSPIKPFKESLAQSFLSVCYMKDGCGK